MGYGCYVHIPFCPGDKCPYCAFYSIPFDKQTADYFVEASIKHASRLCREDIATLYFGGGTPTSLTSKQIERLLYGILSQINTLSYCEITFETSPEAIDDQKLNALHKYGVNRLSIGVQSFSNDLLKKLGRRHDSSMARNAIQKALAKNFDVTIDLMYGIPGQDMAEWEFSLKEAVNYGIDHISLYCLSYESGTPYSDLLDNGHIERTSEDIEQAMYFRAIDILADAGFDRYELSSFARDGKISRHNVNYWLGGGYYGIGPAAHGYYPGPPDWIRYANVANLADYIDRIEQGAEVIDSEEELSPAQRIEEFIMLRLRLAEGFSRKDIENELPQVDLKEFVECLQKPIKQRFLAYEAGRFFIPKEMLFVSNSSIVAALRAVEKRK